MKRERQTNCQSVDRNRLQHFRNSILLSSTTLFHHAELTLVSGGRGPCSLVPFHLFLMFPCSRSFSLFVPYNLLVYHIPSTLNSPTPSVLDINNYVLCTSKLTLNSFLKLLVNHRIFSVFKVKLVSSTSANSKSCKKIYFILRVSCD